MRRKIYTTMATIFKHGVQVDIYYSHKSYDSASACRIRDRTIRVID